MGIPSQNPILTNPVQTLNKKEDLDMSVVPISQNTDFNTIPAPANSVVNQSVLN